MRKSLGVAGLLALLVLPLTGSAGATGKLTDPEPVCQVVLLADVNANAGVSIHEGVVLGNKYDGLRITAPADGKVFVEVCVDVDASVALRLKSQGLIQVGVGKSGGQLVTANAGLEALTSAGGQVDVSVKVCVEANVGWDAQYPAPDSNTTTLLSADADASVTKSEPPKECTPLLTGSVFVNATIDNSNLASLEVVKDGDEVVKK